MVFTDKVYLGVLHAGDLEVKARTEAASLLYPAQPEDDNALVLCDHLEAEEEGEGKSDKDCQPGEEDKQLSRAAHAVVTPRTCTYITPIFIHQTVRTILKQQSNRTGLSPARTSTGTYQLDPGWSNP